MLLIHPPQVRNCEPPVALAHLAGALIAAGEPVSLLDGALEGYLWLCDQPPHDNSERQATRVRRNKKTILEFERNITSIDKYKRRVADIKLLASSSRLLKRSRFRVSPADFDDAELSPLKSSDLIYSWNHPDENLYFPWFSQKVGELLHLDIHNHVGISIGYLSQALTGMAICGWIKREFPQIKIILGGSLINSWGKSPAGVTFLKSCADKIQCGAGERDIVEFAGREYRGEGKPDFLDLYNRPESEDYMSPGRILPYSAASGCSWQRCTFCSETYEKNPYCEKSPHQVLSQLRSLVEMYKPDLIHLCDSEISQGLIDEMVQNPPGCQWYGFSRFLTAMTDMEYCRKLAASRCKMLCLGLESGDQEVLNKLKKGIRLDIVSQILKNLKDVGILTYVYIMFGTPSETRKKALKTRDFIIAHSDYISFLNVSIFNMPIGSHENRDLDSMEFYEGDLAIYRNFVHPKGWSRSLIREFIEKDIKKIPEIRKILIRTPPVFTSSHGSFFSPQIFK